MRAARASVTTAHMKTSLCTLVIALCLVGCGGSSANTQPASASEGDGAEHREGGEHHGVMSAGLTALHDVLAPTWHAEPGATRAGLACTNAAQLDERSRAVAAEPAAEGWEADAWTAATTQLTATSSALVAECTAAGPAVEERLSTLHDAFHALVER